MNSCVASVQKGRERGFWARVNTLNIILLGLLETKDLRSFKINLSIEMKFWEEKSIVLLSVLMTSPSPKERKKRKCKRDRGEEKRSFSSFSAFAVSGSRGAFSKYLI